LAKAMYQQQRLAFAPGNVMYFYAVYGCVKAFEICRRSSRRLTAAHAFPMERVNNNKKANARCLMFVYCFHDLIVLFVLYVFGYLFFVIADVLVGVWQVKVEVQPVEQYVAFIKLVHFNGGFGLLQRKAFIYRGFDLLFFSAST
jgi:hypothetical protein